MSWTPEDIRRSRDAITAAIRDAGGDVLPNGTCRCPFHDDQSPSAGLKLLDKGHWHFRCFPCNWGGDVFDVIAKARGCTFPMAREIAQAYVGGAPPAEPPKRKPSRVFPTVEAAAEAFAAWKGGTVSRIYRWTPDWYRARIALPDDKTFVEITRADGGWVQKAPARPHPLYRVHELRPGPVAVHEGEKACDASWELKVQAVTSGGSNSAALADWSPLAGRLVAIFPDNDSPGEKYASAVAEILRGLTPPAQVKIVRLPGLPPGGDLVEFLQEKRK